MTLKLVDDKDFVREHGARLRENEGYCPCALVKNEDTKCMCKDFREKILKGVVGKCECGYFEILEDEE